MSAVIKIGETRATFAEGRWTCVDADAAAALNGLVPADGFSPSDPAPEQTMAEEAVRVFGAEIVSIDPPEESEEGTVH